MNNQTIENFNAQRVQELVNSIEDVIARVQELRDHAPASEDFALARVKNSLSQSALTANLLAIKLREEEQA